MAKLREFVIIRPDIFKTRKKKVSMPVRITIKGKNTEQVKSSKFLVLELMNI